MSYTKLILLLLILLSGCAQIPQQRPPGYIPKISQNEMALFRNAITLLRNNEPSKAELLFKKLIEDNSEISGPWVNLGLIYFNNKQYSKAEMAVSTALRLNSQNSYALNLSGMLAIKKGNINEAQTLYATAINHNNNYAIAYFNLALLYDIYYQDVDIASGYYRQYLRLVNNNDKQTVDWLEQLQSSTRRF